jgi:EAL and modified HD-GYP domain-containing signal transduction protein
LKSVPANPADTPDTSFLRYVARQPILDCEEKVIGYELLFRDGIQDCFASPDPESASRSTLNTSMLMGIDTLCDGRRAFINCTRDVLIRDYITLLRPDQAVIEIVESVECDDLVIAACQRAKAESYWIALDDFAFDDPRLPLLKLADVVKIDLRATSIEKAAEMVKRHGTAQCRMLAEKVETRDEFQSAKKAGFQYFQGYFFRTPELMQAREIPANRFSYLKLLKATSKPDPEPKEIEDVLKSEPSVCYRLLRYLNSPVFGLAHEIRSVGHAIALLGLRQTCKWIRLASTLVIGQNKPTDLVLTTLVRARMCELLGEKVDSHGADLFLMGLLSLMDSLLEVPMGIVLQGLSLSRETKDTLLGTETAATPIYQLMLAHERGQWQKVSEISGQLGISESFSAECQWKALQWAREMSAPTKTT